MYQMNPASNQMLTHQMAPNQMPHQMYNQAPLNREASNQGGVINFNNMSYMRMLNQNDQPSYYDMDFKSGPKSPHTPNTPKQMKPYAQSPRKSPRGLSRTPTKLEKNDAETPMSKKKLDYGVFVQRILKW